MSENILNSMAVVISNRQEISAIAFVGWIVIGLVVGLLGSKILNKRGQNLITYVLFSVMGAIVGGFLANLLGKPVIRGVDLYSLLVSAVGAAVFLFVYHALFRRRHFLNMG